MSLKNLPVPPGKPIEVLALSPFREDHLALHSILTRSSWTIRTQAPWRIRGVDSWAEADAVLRRIEVPILICECQLPDRTWRDVLSQTALLPHPPHLIVTARLADEHLWAEVLNLGGYDVLAKPFDPAEVCRVIALAWWHWEHGSSAKAAGA